LCNVRFVGTNSYRLYGIIGMIQGMTVCRKCGFVTSTGVNYMDGAPKPTCKNRNRRTAKCRRACCRRAPRKTADDGRLQTTITLQGASVRQQLAWWGQRPGRSRAPTPPATALSSQDGAAGSRTSPEADGPEGSGDARAAGVENPQKRLDSDTIDSND
jgi:hypothetical protein